MTKQEKIEAFYENRERQELLEHRDVLLAIAATLKTKEGLLLFKYLFKTLEVTNLPDRGMEEKDLYEYLGFLRAGNSIYKLTCEADFTAAANIVAKIERERYEHITEEYRINNSNED